MRFKQEFKMDFGHQARTLKPEEVCPNHKYETGPCARTHPDGWTITGEIHEDYYYWVNDFKATHPKLGWVRGDFEDTVEASSKKAYDDFVSKHPFYVWDYHDI